MSKSDEIADVGKDSVQKGEIAKAERKKRKRGDVTDIDIPKLIQKAEAAGHRVFLVKVPKSVEEKFERNFRVSHEMRDEIW